jgi:hypothetical protein
MKVQWKNSMKSSETAALIKKAEDLKQKGRYPESLMLFKEASRGFRVRKDIRGVLECALSVGDVSRMIPEGKGGLEKGAEALRGGPAVL